MSQKKDKNNLNYSPAISIAFNYDRTLPDKLGILNDEKDTIFPIKQLYMSDAYSITGSGRGGNALANREFDFKYYIDQAHKNGMNMNYLWNSISMGGMEWNETVTEKLYNEAKELIASGIDCITVAIPRLALLLKTHFPQLKVSCSVNNHIDSVEKARQLINYCKVDNIIIDHRCSRNFQLMKAIHKEIPSISLSVLANESCLPNCALQIFHQDYLAQMSRKITNINMTPPDLCHILCGIEKLLHPLNVLKAPWIRPEDIHHLFDNGVSFVKLAGRTKDSDWILNLARIYAKGKFDGDIWPFIEKSGLVSKEWSFYLGKSLSSCHYKVQNEDLKGFINPFLSGLTPCVQTSNGCGNCKWCHQWMYTVSIPSNRKERLDDLKKLLDMINTKSKNWSLPRNALSNQSTACV